MRMDWLLYYCTSLSAVARSWLCVLGHRLSRLLFRARLPDYGIYCFRVTVISPADGRICGECNTELLTAVRAVRTIDVACYQRLFNSPGDLRDPQVAKSDFDSLCNVIERENCPYYVDPAELDRRITAAVKGYCVRRCSV